MTQVLSQALRLVWRAPRNAMVGIMLAYRALISPLYGNVCRYYPSCSQYSLDAFRHKGFVLGLWLTVRRLIRCNPWSAGGVDHVTGSELHRRSLLIAAGRTEDLPHVNTDGHRAHAGCAHHSN